MPVLYTVELTVGSHIGNESMNDPERFASKQVMPNTQYKFPNISILLTSGLRSKNSAELAS